MGISLPELKHISRGRMLIFVATELLNEEVLENT